MGLSRPDETPSTLVGRADMSKTERSWIIERTLTLTSGPSALEAVLGIGAAVSRGYGMPDSSGVRKSGWGTQGHVLLVADREHAWRQLAAAGVDRELSSVLEPRDSQGKVRALTLEDVSTLAETLGRVRPVLAIVAGLAPKDAPLVAGLADLAEQHSSALVAVSAEPVDPRLEALAHSVLRTFERPSGRFALRRGLRRCASRIGPRGDPIGFSLRGDVVSWDGIIEDTDSGEPEPVIEHEAEVEQEPARTLGTQLAAAVESALEDALADDPERALEVVDPESAFLLEQLAQGPRRARDVQRHGVEQGFGVRTLRRRAQALGVVRRKASMRGGWLWELPRSEIRQA